MQKILVIKLRHHGDVLLTTALYRALVEQLPGVRVDTLIYKETTPLLQNNPHLNQVLCIDRKLKGFARLKAELKLLFQVRRTGYDAVVHLTDQWVGALITGFSKAPVRVQMQYAKRKQAAWHACFNRRLVPPPRGQAHAVELNLLCLQAFNINPAGVKGQPTLVPLPAQMTKADELLQQHGIAGPFVLIHPAARWPFKCWEDTKFAAVVAHLLRRGLNVVLTCSPDDIEVQMTREIEHLAREHLLLTLRKPADTMLGGNAPNPISAALPDIPHSGFGQLLNLGGQMSLPLLTALLSKCAFYVGVDSAPMHMAAALNVPQVALFGPSWVNEWRPWSDKATVIYAGDHGPLPHPDSINTDDPTRLLAAIPLDVVIGAVDRLADQVQHS
ncbi:putative lipopolysaccharide heptosyltransferase III [Limnobacter sp.]|uniref:putative lipopolysaccharide heptosyltransferase III n=1 Tax=Limnobacter sp. TaxID=2003368 RepID=UPI00351794D7